MYGNAYFNNEFYNIKSTVNRITLYIYIYIYGR